MKHIPFFIINSLRSLDQLVRDVQVNVLVDLVALESGPVVTELDELVDAGLVEVSTEVALVLAQDLGLGFFKQLGA